MLNVVVLNGGRGAAPLIKAVLSRQGVNLTSVVNAYDDGKSTGDIRRFFGMLGPSDIRKVQELMLPESDPDHESSLHLFQYRYPLDVDRGYALTSLRAYAEGSSDEIVGVSFRRKKINAALRRFAGEFVNGLSLSERIRGEELPLGDCSIMNCLYAGAYLTFDRNFETVTRYFDVLFRLKGTVLPTSIENKKLAALRENGDVLYSEAEIVELRSNVRIESIYLLDEWLDKRGFEPLSSREKRRYLDNSRSFVSASNGVVHALQEADIVIYSAGTQHSSLYPTYMSSGIAKAIAENRQALKVFVTNIGADYETPSYVASDFIKGAYRYLNASGNGRYSWEALFDAVLVNEPSVSDSNHVTFDPEGFKEIPVDLILGDFEAADGSGKHDGDKLASVILDMHESMSMVEAVEPGSFGNA